MPSSPIAEARFVFFGGKGGVGKTTCAAASAIAMASNRRVLALSLDPAHSIRDVLGGSAFSRQQPSPPRPPKGQGEKTGLDVLELDARREFDTFMREHREELRVIADRGTYFDDEDVGNFLDLSLPGLDEVTGLLKLGELAQSDKYELIVVDLPPTGHALRLFDVSETFGQLVVTLELMQDKHRFTVSSLTRSYAPDAIDTFLESLRKACTSARAALLAERVSAFVLVSQTEPMVLAETARYAARLRELGSPPTALVLNASDHTQTGELPAQLRGLPTASVPWFDQPPTGPKALRQVFSCLAPLFGRKGMNRRAFHAPDDSSVASGPLRISPAENDKRMARNEIVRRKARTAQASPDLERLVDTPARLLIFGGKGGVGKTTIAAATALLLARRQPTRPIVLMSIDPAHSLGDSLGGRFGDQRRAVMPRSRLSALELDPTKRWQEFRKHWASESQKLFGGLASGRLDPVYDRHIAEELSGIQPTGLDELQAATAVIDLLNENPEQLVIVDSAPTGHLLRFLESPELVLGWAKELMRVLLKYKLASQLKHLSEDLLTLTRQTKALQRVLQDPSVCELVVVTMAQPAVIAETERLIERLRGLRVPVHRIVVNQVTEGARNVARLRALQRRHRDLQFLLVARQPKPVQGIPALEALAA
jgi:arsenite/tail-anchored protein-transporting ATPase